MLTMKLLSSVVFVLIFKFGFACVRKSKTISESFKEAFALLRAFRKLSVYLNFFIFRTGLSLQLNMHETVKTLKMS